MKRARLLSLILVGVALALAASACGTPKDRAEKFLTYLPQRTDTWKLDARHSVKLLTSTVTSKGHAIQIYEGPHDLLAYVVIEVYPTDDAADVAAADIERAWRLQGLAPEKDRAQGQVTAKVAQTELVRYALFVDGDVVVEVDAIAPDAETPVSDEAFAELLTMVRNAYGQVVTD